MFAPSLMEGVSNMFENKLIKGIHASRYIASWLRAGGAPLYYGEDIVDFRKWLLSMNLTEDEAEHIVRLATNGKLELEGNAEKFIRSLPPI
jgi:hypothetical protein